MKKSFVLLLTATVILLAGCNKTEDTEFIGITYDNSLFFYIGKVTFSETLSGGNVITFENGSQSDFNNPEKTNVFYTRLTLRLEGEVTQNWEGEYELTGDWNESAGTMQYSGRYFNNGTGQNEETSFSHELLSGTVNITAMSGSNYKISFDGTTMADAQVLPLKVRYEGAVTIETE